jgi:hypothetical protein
VDAATGEIRRAFSTSGQPGGVVHVRCNNRRESVCPSCSATYKRDARRIVLSGLSGGKGVPASVAGHPALFVTLTAPSFGPVHSRRSKGKHGEAQACRPRRGKCTHGRPAGCHVKHGAGDRLLGTPLCADCFDYAGAVVWNSLVPALWKATRAGVESAVAAAAGLTVAALRRQLRITFVKVAEMQARGLVHLHAVIRVDGRSDDPGEVVSPPGWATTGLVADCLGLVLAAVAVQAPNPHDLTGVAGPLVVRWGSQVDVRAIALDGATEVGRVANYLAKYLTKSVQAGGLLDRPVRSLGHLARLRLDPHARRLVETCWRLGQREDFAAGLDAAAGRVPGRASGLLRWSHSFGFGGHWISKARAWSTTFGRLRTVRRRYAGVLAAALSGRPVGPGAGGELVVLDPFGRPPDDPGTVTAGSWRYAGRGLHPASGQEPPPPDTRPGGLARPAVTG